MTARILDGRAIARQVYDEIGKAVSDRISRGAPRPRLATVLVGDDPASAMYVALKQRNARGVVCTEQARPTPKCAKDRSSRRRSGMASIVRVGLRLI